MESGILGSLALPIETQQRMHESVENRCKTGHYKTVDRSTDSPKSVESSESDCQLVILVG